MVIDKKIDSLPFHGLPWDDFERLVWELVQATERLSPCHRYGTPGQAQGGIDIAGRAADGRWYAFQVKQVAKFTEASAGKALDTFVHGPRPHGATRLIIVTACKGTRTQVRDLAHRYQASHPDLTLGEIWDAEHLARLLRAQPLIVARYFGDDAACRFCDNDALRELVSSGGSRNVGISLAAADPFSLEVHEAITVDHDTQDSPLPVYYRRPFDDELDTAVDQALAGRSVMKVLLGDSSTGKSRAAWEAIQRLPEEWRLFHPTGHDDLLGSIDSLTPRTVLWLNEINRYLLSGDTDRDEQVAARLAELLRSPRNAPVLALGTAWYEHWSTMTTEAGSERPQTKALLARCWIRVPETFSEHEVSALMASEQTDRRMLQAARLAESGHVIQFLAGGPAQLERYETGSPAARAVLQAAMDARRLGHGLDLPHAFLKAAAAAYLTSLQRDLAQPHWFRQAAEYLSAPCRGVRGPLAPVPGFSLTDMQEPSHYRLSDFVELYARRHRQLVCPGEEFWSAAAQYSAGARDRVALSRAALDRGRVMDAESLALAAAEEGEGAALYTLARWIGEHGRDDEDPLSYYELAAELGNAEAQVAVAWRYECEERLDEAELWYRKAAGAKGRVDAVVGLASVLSRRGEDLAAAELNEAAVKSGFFGARAVEYQARLLADDGQHERALLLTTQSFKAGNTEAFTGLAWTYRYKDTPRAIEVFLHATNAGDTNAPRELAWVYEEEGDTARADHYCEIAVSLGETNVLRGLGMIRRSRGDYHSAAGLFWRAYNLGLRHALAELARLREEEGNLKSAERLFWRVLEEGDQSAARDLVRILETSGRTRQAEELAARSVDLLEVLARARAARGEREAAEHLLAVAISEGHPNLLLSFADHRHQRGDIAGAELALRQAQDAGVYFATEQLAKLLERKSN
ncbi:tetratricopeptide repeat protein [Streptomyces sp. 8N616]|uniref:tetratricopeptide repeat protein n=1 Tax=Streptomyces sp. 8N616 TaxID=3457414 RepID=UPI003FD08DC8